jgi:hypothetical protein
MIMKKVIFFTGIVTLFSVSCTSSKKNISATSKQDYYKDNHYAEKYMDAPGLISRDVALHYINAFQKHKYKGFGEKKLENAWSTFDRATLDRLIKDPETDSIFFFLAAYPKKDKTVEKEKRRHPFVILEAVPEVPKSEKGKGSANSSATLSTPVYLLPVQICPPPNAGCRVPGS